MRFGHFLKPKKKKKIKKQANLKKKKKINTQKYSMLNT